MAYVQNGKPSMADVHPIYGDLDDEAPGISWTADGVTVFATKRECVAHAEGAGRRKSEVDEAAGWSVYFIRRGTSRVVKIGVAKDPWKRLRQLQTGSADRLKIVAVMPGTPADERALHRRFADLRLGGEWFRMSPEITAMIREVKRRHRCDSAPRLLSGG